MFEMLVLTKAKSKSIRQMMMLMKASSAIPPSTQMTTNSPSSTLLTAQEREEWNTLSLSELIASEAAKRKLAEAKAEELRQLVGIRYRVLIHTADNISKMKDTAEDSINTIQQLQHTIQTILFYSKQLSNNQSSRNKQKSNFALSLAEFTALPEQIWAELAGHNHISACELFLRSQIIYNHLKSYLHTIPATENPANHNKNPNENIFNNANPADLRLFISLHYSCLQEFSEIILSQANQRLAQRDLAIEQYLQPLVATILVTGNSVQATLKLFLSSRTNWIKHIISSANKALTLYPNCNPAAVISHSLTAVTLVLQTTIIHLAALLGPVKKSQSSHLPTQLQAFYNNATHQENHSAYFTSYSISPSELNTTTRTWLDELIAQLHSNTNEISLTNLLNRLHTGKQLAVVRDKILAQLAFQMTDSDNDNNPANDSHQQLNDRKERKEVWEECCLTVFPSESSSSNGSSKQRLNSLLSLWDLVFAKCFNNRFKAVVEQSFQRLQLQQTIAQALRAWNETQPAPSTANHSKQSSSTAAGEAVNLNKSVLPKELLGFRESQVNSIVVSFITELSTLANDVRYLLQCDFVRTEQQLIQQQRQKQINTADPSPVSSSSSSSILTALHSVYVDFSSLRSFIQAELTPHIHRMYSSLVAALVNDLRKKLGDLEAGVLNSMSSASRWKSAQCIELVEQAVFIGRVCYSITQQPSLMSFTRLLDNSSSNNSSSTIFSPTNASSAVQASLSTTARSAFRIWTRYTAAIVHEQFEANFNPWLQANNTFANAFTNKVLSQTIPIAIPTHESSYIGELLLTLQERVYTIYGYQVQGEILTWLLNDLSNAILTALQSKVKSPAHFNKLSSNSKLQLFFDIQYLFAVLRLSSLSANNDDRQRYTQIISTIDNQLNIELDAVNWTVSKPHMNNTLYQAIQRTNLLYGLLIRFNPLPPVFNYQPAKLAAAVNKPAPKDAKDSVGETQQFAINLISLAPAGARVLPLSAASLYPSKNATTNFTTPNKLSIYPSSNTMRSSGPHSAGSSNTTAGSAGSSTTLSHSVSANLSDLKATGRHILGKLNLY
jgi:hypothetical protein